MFPRKNIHKYTWTAPNGRVRNQIDHVAVNGKFKRLVKDTRSYRGADSGSDHNLVITTVRLRLRGIVKNTSNTRRYDIAKLKIPEVKSKSPQESNKIKFLWQGLKTQFHSSFAYS